MDLTRAIGALMPDIEEEVGYAVRREFGEVLSDSGGDEEGNKEGGWKEVPLHEKVLQIVSVVSSRVFVTKELSRREEWIQASIQYTADVFAGGQELKR